jgi:lysophospholipase L1-like esterase
MITRQRGGAVSERFHGGKIRAAAASRDSKGNNNEETRYLLTRSDAHRLFWRNYDLTSGTGQPVTAEDRGLLVGRLADGTRRLAAPSPGLLRHQRRRIESQLASEIFARLDTDCSGKGIVIVNAGTNDAIRTGDMRSAEATIQAFADAHPQLVLSTVPRVDNASVQAHIDELNAWLRLYAMSSKHQLLDFAAAVDPCATCISTDAIHYTPLGYQKIAAVISQSVH